MSYGGSSYTIEDTTVSNMWQLDMNDDFTEIFGTSLTTGETYRWSSLPPTAGNRTAIYSGTSPYGIATFKYTL